MGNCLKPSNKKKKYGEKGQKPNAKRSKNLGEEDSKFLEDEETRAIQFDLPSPNEICGWISKWEENTGNFLYAAGKKINFYNYKTGKIVHTLLAHNSMISQCEAFSSNLLTSSYDRTLKLFTLPSPPSSPKESAKPKEETPSTPSSSDCPKLKQTLKGHDLAVTSFCVDKPGMRVVSGARDYSVRVWDIETGTQEAQCLINRNMVTSMNWICNSNTSLVQCSEDLTFKIWDLRDAIQKMQQVSVGPNIATCCDVDPTGNLIATGHRAYENSGPALKVWDVRKLQCELFAYDGHRQPVEACNFISFKSGEENSLGNTSIVTASVDTSLHLVDINTGAMLAMFMDSIPAPYRCLGIVQSNKDNVNFIASNNMKTIQSFSVNSQFQIQKTGNSAT